MADKKMPYMYCRRCNHAFRYNGRLNKKLRQAVYFVKRMFNKGNETVFKCPNCNKKDEVIVKFVKAGWLRP